MRTDSVESMGPWSADDHQDTQPHTDLGTKAEPTRTTTVNPNPTPSPNPDKK